jgi:C4-dicarboxylate transporter, DctQ subunit
MKNKTSPLIRIGKLLISGNDLVIKGMAVLSGMLVVTLTSLICLAVLLRYYFSLSVGWATELTEYFIFLVVMLATPWVLKNNKHVMVDVIVNIVNPKVRRQFAIITNFIGGLASGALFYYSMLATYENYVKGTMMIKIMPIPKYWPLLFIPIMAFFTTLQFAIKIWESYHLDPFGNSMN